MTDKNYVNAETAAEQIQEVEAVRHTDAAVNLYSDSEVSVTLTAYLEADAFVAPMVETAENLGYTVDGVTLADRTERLKVHFVPDTE